MLALLAALYRLVCPLLFLFDPEHAHGVGALFLRALHRSRFLRALLGRPPTLPVEALGHRFRSPIGVAAGFDKAGTLYDGLAALGFGFVEIGTVTAEAQPGNPRPRVFRLPADRALVNRMGFNNPGATAVARALRHHPAAACADGFVLGVNIGKSRVTPLAEAADDYARSARLLGPLADYLVVNVSSPNTPGLRTLQALEPLRAILQAVQRELAALPRPVPLLVKIAPDLADEDIDGVADLALELGLSGIVATNTTIARDGLRSSPALVERAGPGGLSGAPLRARSLAVLRRLRARVGSALTLIAAGGIANADEAWEAIRAGASLVQVYTAFVYEGPALPRSLVLGLRRRLDDAGLREIDDAVGRDAGARQT